MVTFQEQVDTLLAGRADRQRSLRRGRLVELFPDGSTWEFYGSTEGQFTACRSEEWLARPARSVAPDPVAP